MDKLPQVQIEHARCMREPVQGWSAAKNLLVLENPLEWGQSLGWALHLRRTLTMLDQTIEEMKRSYAMVDPSVRFDAQTFTFHFRTGYKIQLGHCRDPDDWEKYFSNQYTYIAFDELVQFEQQQYEKIKSRARTVDPVLMKMLKVRSMSNPVIKRERGENFRVENPHWVRERFVDPAPEGNKTLYKKLTRRDGRVEYRTRIYLPARLHDNPISEYVDNYELTLLEMPPYMRQALLEGDWYCTPASYFGYAWNPRLHVCDPFQIPSHWPRFRSMDWGYKKPGCIHWWALDDEENLYCEKELTFQEMEVPQVVKRVQEIEKSLGLWEKGASKLTGPADDQIWERRGDGVLTKAERFSQLGVPWLQADKRNRKDNAQRISERLKDHNDGATTAGLVFFRTCPKAITTLPGIQAVDGDPEMPLDGGEDHWFDSIGYACAFASNGRGCIPYTPKDEEDWPEDVAQRPRMGNYGYGSSVM